LFLLTFVIASHAADPASEPRTLLTERGQLLFQDDFNQPPDKPWNIHSPQWEAIDGALQATHLPPFPANHGPVMEHPLKARNVIAQLDFKLDGKSRATLHFNKANGHLCRALLLPTAFYIIRRDSGPVDKGTRLDADETPIAPDLWHTLVVELLGGEMVASLDGSRILFARRDDLDQDKLTLMLEAGGGTAWFRNLRIWEALPNKDWEATRAKLQSARERAQK
jgi:hypothetical protein